MSGIARSVGGLTRIDQPAPALSCLTLVSFVLAIPALASASTFIVSDFGDSGAPGQLRSLINAAAPGDTILIPLGTIVLTGAPGENANATGDLDIVKDLTIVGAGAELTVIDANHVDRVFDIRPAVTVTISSMAMRNGSVNPAAPVDPSGGGLLNRGVSTTLVDVIVEGNFAGGGGGIANFAGTVELNGSTVRNNSSTGTTANGGGISNFGRLEIAHSTISGNAVFGTSASTLGGGVINNGTMTMRDSTVVGNVASGNLGGGVYQTAGGPMALTNVTITGNRVGTGLGFGFGGGLANGFASGSVTIVSTLIANNETGPAGTGPDVSGSFTSQGFNLIGKQDGSTGFTAATDQTGTVASPLDPKLDPAGLKSNGGPTQTVALLFGSPATDQGINSGLTVLSSAISNSTTAINVSDASNIPAGVGYTILIDSEQMVVTNKAGNSLTVTRGANSTTAAPHSVGTSLYPAFDQRGSGFPRTVDDPLVANATGGDSTDIGAYEWSSGFTDDPLVAGNSVIRAVHITELRTRIDALRAEIGLAAYPYADPELIAGTTTVRAAHILDLRTALSQVYFAAGLPPPTFTDPSPSAGTTMRAAHMAELRAAVLGIE